MTETDASTCKKTVVDFAPDTLYIRFGAISFKRDDCETIHIRIGKMVCPPNRMPLRDNFEASIMTNRNYAECDPYKIIQDDPDAMGSSHTDSA